MGADCLPARNPFGGGDSTQRRRGPAARATTGRLVALVTVAVWLWGAAVFVVWFILGDRVPN